MGKEHPDHHDAELAFRAYEMRRETVMRDSRNAINRDFWPKSYADAVAVTKADHPLNAAWRQNDDVLGDGVRHREARHRERRLLHGIGREGCSSSRGWRPT